MVDTLAQLEADTLAQLEAASLVVRVGDFHAQLLEVALVMSMFEAASLVVREGVLAMLKDATADGDAEAVELPVPIGADNHVLPGSVHEAGCAEASAHAVANTPTWMVGTVRAPLPASSNEIK